MLLRADFHLLYDGGLWMLISFLHRNEAACLSTSCFFYCFSHNSGFPAFSGGLFRRLAQGFRVKLRTGYPFWQLKPEGSDISGIWRITKEYLWGLLRWPTDLTRRKLLLVCNYNRDRVEQCTIYWCYDPLIVREHRLSLWHCNWGSLFCGISLPIAQWPFPNIWSNCRVCFLPVSYVLYIPYFT